MCKKSLRFGATIGAGGDRCRDSKNRLGPIAPQIAD
jgi:hypothetical protein